MTKMECSEREKKTMHGNMSFDRLQFEQMLLVVEWIKELFVFHLCSNEDVFDWDIFPTNFRFYVHNDNNSKEEKNENFCLQ